jgi:hypothetical protein
MNLASVLLGYCLENVSSSEKKQKECATYKAEASPVMMITIKENVCRFFSVKDIVQ